MRIGQPTASRYPAGMTEEQDPAERGDGSSVAVPIRPLLERRDRSATPSAIVAAARAALLEDGFAKLSTRRVAEVAGVPLSQIHYHFGSKQQLVLAVLADQNERLLERQASMFGDEQPLSRQWEMACDYLEVDLGSGYVRLLQELIAAGWSDPALAASVRDLLAGWYGLLASVARREADRMGGLGPFTPEEVGALMGLPFIGAEAMILLGFEESELPARSALRKIGALIRGLEDGGNSGHDGDGSA
jgi:AcrR family transcriptional regulator